MPELRVTISEKMDKILEQIVETGLFSSKADLVRCSIIAYLRELGREWAKLPVSAPERS